MGVYTTNMLDLTLSAQIKIEAKIKSGNGYEIIFDIGMIYI